MDKSRPVTAVLFGVLNLAFGVMGVLGSLAAAVAMAVVLSGIGPDELREGVNEELIGSPVVAGVNIANIVLGVILAVVQIFAGVGLLKFRPWGRTLSNQYAGVSIVLVLITMGVHGVYSVLPALQNSAGLQTDEEFISLVGAGVGVISGCMGLIYPVLLLIFMNRPDFRRRIMAA